MTEDTAAIITIKDHMETLKETLTRFMAKNTKSLKKSVASRLVGKIEMCCGLAFLPDVLVFNVNFSQNP